MDAFVEKMVIGAIVAALFAALSSFLSRDRKAELKAMAADGTPDGTTSLMTAALTGRLALTRDLIKAGADVNACDANKWTALMFAASHDELETVELLLRRGRHFIAQR